MIDCGLQEAQAGKRRGALGASVVCAVERLFCPWGSVLVLRWLTFCCAPTICSYIDDDHSGVSVAQAGLLLADEGGTGAVVEIVLDSKPLGDVVLFASVNDTSNCAVASGEVCSFFVQPGVIISTLCCKQS